MRVYICSTSQNFLEAVVDSRTLEGFSSSDFAAWSDIANPDASVDYQKSLKLCFLQQLS